MSDYPDNYLNFNEQVSKNLNVVIEIEGVDTIISMQTLYKKIVYGDPDIHYGDPGLVYGGLVAFGSDQVKTLISLESNLMISQRIEPEQGRGSVAQFSVILIDKDQFVSRLMTPGIIVDEPLGNKLVKVHLGYQQSSYPQDYVTIFRGYISSCDYLVGKYSIQMSDANSKKRAQLFFSGTTNLSAGVSNVATVIPVVTSQDFFTPILGPSGSYDPILTTYLQIEDEVMSYGPTDIAPTSFTVARGQRGTSAVAHASNSDVSNTAQLQENGITLALKLMLSGWNGPYVSAVEMQTIRDTISAGDYPNAVLFESSVDLIETYGLVIGDQAIISGNASGNDGTYFISSIESINGGTNNLLRFTTNLPNLENPATGTIAFRSQFDTLPTTMGQKMSPMEVDVQRFIDIRNQLFSQGEYTLQFYITDRVNGKEFIDKEIMLPFGSYSITRFGKISMTATQPPIAGSKLPVLDKTSVIEPTMIKAKRAINNRTYFNEIQYRYDANDAGEFKTVDSVIDSLSLSNIAISSVLPIESKGLKTSLAADLVVIRRGNFLISRYRSGAIQYTMKVNWRVGSIIETGDVVLVNDNGDLQIINFETGERNLGSQLLEVIDRKFDVRTGQVELVLLTGLGYNTDQRFATISPSSYVESGATTTRIRIRDSFGSLYPGNEPKKWEQLFGTQIRIHTYDYTTYDEETTLIGFEPADPYVMIVTALSVAPPADSIVEIANYPSNTDPLDQAIQKLLFAHIDPSITIVTGVSPFAFTVSAPDAAKFTPDLPVLVHDATYSVLSPECIVDSVVGTQVNLKQSLGFTPSAGQTAELIGFIDGGGPYRVL